MGNNEDFVKVDLVSGHRVIEGLTRQQMEQGIHFVDFCRLLFPTAGREAHEAMEAMFKKPPPPPPPPPTISWRECEEIESIWPLWDKHGNGYVETKQFLSVLAEFEEEIDVYDKPVNFSYAPLYAEIDAKLCGRITKEQFRAWWCLGDSQANPVVIGPEEKN